MTVQAEPTTARTRTKRARRADEAAGAVETATAPTKTPTKSPSKTPTTPTRTKQKPAEPARPAERAPGRSRSAAAQRAYAKRAQREGRGVERPMDDDIDHAAGRASFVVLIIVLLTVGVAATLWLSTQAIADSYRLDTAKKEADHLAERAAVLQREVTNAESAASLAERAKAMGMVPAGDPARLIVQPDGTVVVVGEPTPAQAPAPPAPPAGQGQQAPPAGQEQPPAGQGQQQSGTTPGAG